MLDSFEREIKSPLFAGDDTSTVVPPQLLLLQPLGYSV
jgi:hypothetical protein